MNMVWWRADHVGSLLRPAELLDARRNCMDEEERSRIEDKSVLLVLERQRDWALTSLPTVNFGAASS